MSDADLAGPESADPGAGEPHSTGPDAVPTPSPVPHAGTRYALLRLLMLVVVGAALYVVGLRGWLLAFAAVLVSGLISLFLLMKQRNDAAVSLERSLDQWRARHAEDEEDAADQGPEHDPDGDRENDTHQPPAGRAGSGT